MFGKTSKITVIGAGAIGGITAGLIKIAGYDVEVVCKYKDLADRVMSTGLHIFGRRRIALSHLDEPFFDQF